MAAEPHTAGALTYPFGKDFTPPPGGLHEVADGVFWLHMPMPFKLNRINLWLLADGDGWTIVDSGLDLPESRAIWERLFAEHLGGRPVKRVVVTHMHPDHMGLAGWLTQRFACDLWMSRTEFLMGRTLVSDTGRPAPDVAVAFYRAAGFDEAALAAYRKRFGQFGAYVSPLPDRFRRLVDGETFEINGRFWQVVTGMGHSPEHSCLYCPALKVLISGDQVLPRISPNVSLFPTEPHGDPLTEWLQSCQMLRARLPGNLLVLPAHQEPFYGLHARATQLVESHERALARLFDHLAEPRRAVDCFPVMFRRPIKGAETMLAVGETLAHLNCLIGRGMITREVNGAGVCYYAGVGRRAQHAPAPGVDC